MATTDGRTPRGSHFGTPDASARPGSAPAQSPLSTGNVTAPQSALSGSRVSSRTAAATRRAGAHSVQRDEHARHGSRAPYFALAFEKTDRRMDPFLIEYRPSDKQRELLQHDSQEFFVVLEGEVDYAIGSSDNRRRMKKGKARGNVRAKTGTLEGVSTLAGYATARNGHRLAFCIMNQGVASLRAAQAFQDRLCELLCR